MPPKLLFDISGVDLDRILFGPQEIREVNMQRGDMEHLNAIVHLDEEKCQIAGYKDVRTDEFWVQGHIPGRPLLPGVIMLEAAGQIASFYMRRVIGWSGFVGFGGVDACKFRQMVVPPARMYLLAEKTWERHGRMGCKAQGIVKAELVFEAEIIGLKLE